MKRRFFGIVAGTCVLALCACGGGGGSSVPHVMPTSTPTGHPSLSCNGSIPIDATQRRPFSSVRHTQSATLSTYVFNSNPTGLAVSVNGASAGKTQVSTKPGFTNAPYIGSIQGPSSTFSVCYSQLMDGQHTVFYNTQSDTGGHLGTIASTPRLSALMRAAPPLQAVRRGPATRPEGGIDRLRIQVHFVTSAIGGDARLAASIERAEGARQAYTLGAVRNMMDRIVSVPEGETPESFSARLRRHPEVADARPLPLRYAQSIAPMQFVPNDTYFDDVNQWGLFRIDTLDAWGVARGSVPIAIIDTGADLTAHDLAGNITYKVKWVFAEPPYPNIGAAAQDQDGHGTNVSGIADAVTNNAYGFAGVAFNAPLQIYRIFPTPKAPNYTGDPNYGASTADEARAINDAVGHGAKVINLSLGSCPGQTQGPDPTEFDAIESAIAAGVVVVAAAGNERSGGQPGGCGSSNTIDFPAAYPGVVAVGATSLTGDPLNPQAATEHVAAYSNSGPGLAVVAPGGDPSGQTDSNPLHWITNLYTLTPADPNPAQHCKPKGNPPLCAALFAGTSQATPHVTGTVALMRSRNHALQPAQVKSILESTADNISDPNQGFGRVDVYRAIAAAAGIVTGAPKPNALNFRAIAYTVTPGSNRPNVLDQTFPAGVPVQSDGSFRVADVPPGSPTFEIGLWYDANGDGIVDAGDYFGSVGPCSASAPCAAAGTINVALVALGFVLK